LRKDSGINEKFVYLTTGEKTEAPKELEFMNILSIYTNMHL